jgi:hypothetical protein
MSVRRKLKIFSVVLAALLLTGCSMRTLDELYRVPRRSEAYNDLQSAIDRSIGDREYCAPLSGENLQTVQMADLDGDGTQEYLLFSKGNSDKPLQILIFRLENEEYVLADMIQSTGGAYDVVEYARVDDKPGYELIVGYQISNQVARSVSVYSFRGGKAVLLMSTNYTKFVPYDINADGRSELMVLHAGESDEASGVAELFYYAGGVMERSNQASMSETVDQLKRIVTSRLHGGQPAVYVASAVGESAIITDVFAMVDGYFTNVSFSNESGTSVQTLRNYYVYADDIDDDSVVELPDLITMRSPADLNIATMQYLIRWYAMTAAGDEVDKVYTYHNFQDGWYMTLDSSWAARVAVLQRGNAYEFYVWDEAFSNAQKLITVYTFTGADREEQALRDNRFVLYKSDKVVYAADMDVSSAAYSITQDTLLRSFHLIHQDWKTGET